MLTLATDLRNKLERVVIEPRGAASLAMLVADSAIEILDAQVLYARATVEEITQRRMSGSTELLGEENHAPLEKSYAILGPLVDDGAKRCDKNEECPPKDSNLQPAD